MSHRRSARTIAPAIARIGVVAFVAMLGAAGSVHAAPLDDPAVALANPASIAPADALPAVWKPQTFDFHYQSFTTFYSCSSLGEKVRRILVALGGDEGTKVRVSGCETSSGIARMPLVRITMTSPVEATPEALAELQKSRPVRELAARVRNDHKEAADIDAQFPAYWQRVSLSRGSLGLAPGDCELVEQIERKILPKLAVRVVSNDMRCTPNQVTLGQPRLEVEALADLSKRDLLDAQKKKRNGE
jgi:hypothetical protein